MAALSSLAASNSQVTSGHWTLAFGLMRWANLHN